MNEQILALLGLLVVTIISGIVGWAIASDDPDPFYFRCCCCRKNR